MKKYFQFCFTFCLALSLNLLHAQSFSSLAEEAHSLIQAHGIGMSLEEVEEAIGFAPASNANCYTTADLLDFLAKFGEETADVIPAFGNVYANVFDLASPVAHQSRIGGTDFQYLSQAVKDQYQYYWFVDNELTFFGPNPDFESLLSGAQASICDGVRNIRLRIIHQDDAVFERSYFAYLNSGFIQNCPCEECPQPGEIQEQGIPQVDPFSFMVEPTRFDFNANGSVTAADLITFLGSYCGGEAAACDLNISLTKLDIECPGEKEGFITVSSINTSHFPVTAKWSNGGSNLFQTDLPKGAYTVTITDNIGCTIEETVLIQELGAFEVTPVITDASCLEQSLGAINLVVNGVGPGMDGPYNFEWNTGENDGDISNLQAGFYAVRISNATCSQLFSFNVGSAQSGMNVFINGFELDCFGSNDGALSAVVEGGFPPYTYNWTNGWNEPDIQNVTKGLYEVFVTDANGCIESDTAVISEPDFLEVSLDAVQQPYCYDSPTGIIKSTPIGGKPPYSYIWNDSLNTEMQTNSSQEGLVAGTYGVTVVDANGCGATPPEMAVLEGQNEYELNLNFVDSMLCDNQIIPVSTGENPESVFSWKGPNNFAANTPEIFVGLPGVYDVTVTNTNGCSAWDAFELLSNGKFLHPEFLASSIVYDTDVLCCIDVSEPVPDSIEWIVDPAGVTEVARYDNAVDYIFRSTGFHQITMRAHLDGCAIELTKTIEVLPVAQLNGSLTPVFSTINSFEISPNPNNGVFVVTANLSAPTISKITIYDAIGNKIDSRVVDGLDIVQAFTLNLPDGINFCYLETQSESRLIPFAVINTP